MDIESLPSDTLYYACRLRFDISKADMEYLYNKKYDILNGLDVDDFEIRESGGTYYILEMVFARPLLLEETKEFFSIFDSPSLCSDKEHKSCDHRSFEYMAIYERFPTKIKHGFYGGVMFSYEGVKSGTKSAAKITEPT